MKKYLVGFLASVSIVVGLTQAPLFAGASATDVLDNPACTTSAGTSTDFCDTKNKSDVWGLIKNIINVMMTIVGILAVIMIIYSGIQYTISHGDSGKITAAKNTLIYSITGLIVALLAMAIVNFVVKGV